MPEIRVKFDAPPTVWRFLSSDAFARVIVGPFGSGKTSGCVTELLIRAAAQKPGADKVKRTRFAIVRNTYRELKDTTRKTFQEWVPVQLGKWNEQDFSFRIQNPQMDCEILFRALDRPEDIKKLLSLELTGAYFNELREIPKHVFDTMGARVGRYPSMKDGGATWSGMWADTNPWHTTHWGYKLFSLRQGLEGNDSDYVLFEQPSGLSVEAENRKNLPLGYYERLMAGKDAEWVQTYIHAKYPAADVGSIWGKLVAAVEARGGVSKFIHPADGVYTSWDLGISDSTAIWFWRVNANRVPDVIDHYESSGEPMSHYFRVIEDRGYHYEKHWLPHDARARTLQTGESIIEQFIQRYGQDRVAIGPELSLRDGIQAARWLFEQPVRFHSRCEKGIEALKEYRYDWDEEARAFSTRPLHNWASHTADAWRYLALVVKYTDLITRLPEPKKEKPIARPTHYGFTMDDLWEGKTPRDRRRI